ncbi:MAG: peroxiredoxin-like family protein [Azospirillaceae bacterium]
MPIPRQKTPPLRLDTLSHDPFDLDQETAERGTLLVFYRGLHCPICARYLKELDSHVPAFAERGFATVAITADGRERTQRMAERVEAANDLRFAYGLTLAAAKDWGLWLSTSRGTTSIGVEEPAVFPEPGLFLVRPDRTLYFASIQTMPFARPPIASFVPALDFVIEKDYPARGEYTGPV